MEHGTHFLTTNHTKRHEIFIGLLLLLGVLGVLAVGSSSLNRQDAKNAKGGAGLAGYWLKRFLNWNNSWESRQ
mgnify:CR=1 FL=1|jgi:hypothetical protein